MADPVVQLLRRLAVAALAILVITTTYADADLWGHVRFGLDIVASGTIHTVDRYAFTSDRPLINHEWLAEAAMAMAYRAAGPTGLIALRVALVAAVYLVVWRSLRGRTTGWAREAILVYAIVGTAWVIATVRPQLFSVLLFTLLLASLRRVEQGSRAALLGWPAIMLVWVNAHGGWIVGLGMIGIWCALAIVRARARQRALLLGAFAAAVLATLVNPYGSTMWWFLAETVRLGRDIAEWQPIVRQPWSHLAMWIVSAIVAAAALWGTWSSGRGTPADPTDRGALHAHAVMSAVLAYASFRVARLDAFFCLTVAMLLAPRLVRSNAEARAPAPRPAPGAWIVVAAAAIAILWPVAVRARTRLSCIEIEGPSQPDAAAAAFIAREQLRGRMLTWFDWGEYAIWYFAPAVQVSMDGRRETVYSSAIVAAHFAFYRDEPGARDLPSRLQADYIWLPATLPVVSSLNAAGWLPLVETPRSIVLARTAEKVYRTGGDEPSRRCFPGP
jgi:hypothetical protein